MNYFTIHSRKLNRDFVFNCELDESRPYRSSYVRLEEKGKTGTLAPQICYGGGFLGETVTSTPATFERDCRTWYRQYMADADDLISNVDDIEDGYLETEQWIARRWKAGFTAHQIAAEIGMNERMVQAILDDLEL